MPLTPGMRLGNFEILAPIGAGGQGEVYRARDNKLGREVAIKIIGEALSEDPARLARFGREAHLLASLNHPNIATIHGLEESNGQPLLVMELVEGETLAERLIGGPIPVDEALPLFEQIAEGLEAAHEKGIIHRDLKPANIKITKEGKPKILDFGLAKALAGEGAAVDLSQSPTLTRNATETGMLLGTASYMSPEQARGKTVDRRTDIWAFGCCLYEALSGLKAFGGDTVTDVLAAVINGEPDWRALPRLPRRLEDLLCRTLRKSVAMRLQHAGDARVALIEAQSPEREPAPNLAARSRLRTALGALVITGVAAVTGWLGGRWTTESSQPERPRYVDVTLGPDEALVEGVTPVLVLSEDGSHLVYNVDRVGSDVHQNRRELVLRRLDRPAVETITDTIDGRCPAISPSGDWMAFFTLEGKLEKLRLDGGHPIGVAKTSAGCSAVWEGDTDILYLDHPTSDLFRVPASGGDAEVVISPERDAGELAIRWPFALPESRGVLFTSFRGSNEQTSVGVLDYSTGTRRVLVSNATSPSYAPTGHLLFVSSGTLLAAPFDLETLELAGPAAPLFHDVWVTPFGAAQYSVSKEGTLAFVPATAVRPSSLYRVTRDGEATTLHQDPRVMGVSGLSPDGKRVAVYMAGDIWTYDLTDETMSRVTVDGFMNHFAIWSPDGRSIAFSSVREGVARMYRVGVDTSEPPQRLGDGHFRLPGSWSPDGRWIAFSDQDEGGRRDIGVVSLDSDGKAKSLLATRFNELSPRFSPDGRWLAYTSDESGHHEVYVQPFEHQGAKKQISSGGGVAPQWNPKGGELLYFHGSQFVSAQLETGEEVVVRSRRVLFAGDYDTYFAVAPDGGSFIMASGELARGRREIKIVLNWHQELERLVPTQK